MKIYKKLELPEDSVFGRKTWRRFSPRWFCRFVDSVTNLIDWLPTIWNDRHWDDYYITKILQKKIELQRHYIVSHNRHTSVDKDNFWMTVTLNLIEREHESYYENDDYMDYTKLDFRQIPGELRITTEYFDQAVVQDKLDEYINKYKKLIPRVKARYNLEELNFNNRVIATFIGRYNQERCRNLIFEILKQKSSHWWD
jgi:hypothetical protein